MIIKGELKTLGNSHAQSGSNYRIYEYIEIGNIRTRKMAVNHDMDDTLHESLGTHVEFSIHKSALWGWRGTTLLALKLADGRVFKSGQSSQFVGYFFIYLLISGLFVGFGMAGLLHELTDFDHVVRGVSTTAAILGLTIWHLARVLKIRNAFGKENLGTMQRI
ncbi:MAG: hypothetical protein Roseis2KO_53770 [Roseivirga sp.]